MISRSCHHRPRSEAVFFWGGFFSHVRLSPYRPFATTATTVLRWATEFFNFAFFSDPSRPGRRDDNGRGGGHKKFRETLSAKTVSQITNGLRIFSRVHVVSGPGSRARRALPPAPPAVATRDRHVILESPLLRLYYEKKKRKPTTKKDDETRMGFFFFFYLLVTSVHSGPHCAHTGTENAVH